MYFETLLQVINQSKYVIIKILLIRCFEEDRGGGSNNIRTLTFTAWTKITKLYQLFFKQQQQKTYFVFHKRKKVMQVGTT